MSLSMAAPMFFFSMLGGLAAATPMAFGEVYTGLQAGVIESSQHRPLVATAGLQDRVSDPLRLEPSGKVFPTFKCLIKSRGSIARFERDIAPIFADIDTGIERLGHDRSPARVRGFPPRNCSRQIKTDGRLCFATCQSTAIHQASRPPWPSSPSCFSRRLPHPCGRRARRSRRNDSSKAKKG